MGKLYKLQQTDIDSLLENAPGMLKSTHKSVAPPPLPEGWTEHKAPTGHSYYYNAATKQSTYTRPNPPPAASIPQSTPLDPSQSFLQYQTIGSPKPSAGVTSDRFPLQSHLQGRGAFHGQKASRGGHDGSRNTRPQPTDKPISRHPIPGGEPWVLVHTKLGRRFVYNSQKDESFWRIPDKLKEGILALDQLRIKEKAKAQQIPTEPTSATTTPSAIDQVDKAGRGDEKFGDGELDSSEYEEVEVTDDEGEDDENPPKRQRTGDDAQDEQSEPVEFNEDDIAYQLAAMGEEYGLDPGEYDDGNMDEWKEGVGGLELTEEDSIALFKDLLNDSGVNPYSPWEKIVEEGKLVDDTRYTTLTTMKARKETWDEWSRDKIKQLRALRAKEEKKDPKIPYLTFLQNHATPKLYWPEFKRKFKKEPEMRDSSLADKDREKFYREHISRLKLPQSSLKADLIALLQAQPLSALNNATIASHLPPAVLSDIRYISLASDTRDMVIESHIQSLPPPPGSTEEEDSEEAAKARLDKLRRQKALEDRERKVAEEKRRQQRHLEFGKGRLREEEAEIARAMNVTKKGLRDHLVEADSTEKATENPRDG